MPVASLDLILSIGVSLRLGAMIVSCTGCQIRRFVPVPRRLSRMGSGRGRPVIVAVGSSSGRSAKQQLGDTDQYCGNSLLCRSLLHIPVVGRQTPCNG